MKFREFADVVRQVQGFRASCSSTPLNTTLSVNTNPTAENFLQSVTTKSQILYTDFIGNYYKVLLYSSSYQKQISNLSQQFYTVKYGITRDQYLLVPYFQLVLNTPSAMNLTQIAFFLIDNPVFEFLYTLPSTITGTSATISFTNFQITSNPRGSSSNTGELCYSKSKYDCSTYHKINPPWICKYRNYGAQ